ncbi:signal protein [Kitasatospora sp. NBC_00458]|uniref:signal protein n=1 Tax=Kitasatospora sp. NBC_00458 TaxID=2903568 RepID=UPI002E1725C1
MYPRRLVALLVGALAVTTACTGAQDPDPAAADRAASSSPSAEDEPYPEPTPVTVGALTSAELQGGWWNWAASTGEARNPITDQDGHLCAQGQAEDVWRLAGTRGGAARRTCTVPLGLPVVFPIVNTFGEASDCLEFMDGAHGSATLDGRALKAEELGATPIDLGTHDGNPFTGVEDHFHTWSCGLWVRLEPLPAGSHELSFQGGSGSFSTSVDYHLEVARPVPAGAV